MFLESIFYFLYRNITSISEFLTGKGPFIFWKTDLFSSILFWYKVCAGTIIALLFLGLVYVAYQMIVIGAKVAERERNAKKGVFTSVATSTGAQRWEQITKKLNSESEADWKIAIIEADAILEDIVGTMDVAGASMGDKLKNIEKSDFLTLESAWEAHKARNRIAHDTDGIPLSRREATRILALYERVFREFKYL